MIPPDAQGETLRGVKDGGSIQALGPGEFADAVFGMSGRNGEVVKRHFNKRHPGWLIHRSPKPLAIAERVTVANPPKFREPYAQFWLPPTASRRLIERGVEGCGSASDIECVSCRA